MTKGTRTIGDPCTGEVGASLWSLSPSAPANPTVGCLSSARTQHHQLCTHQIALSSLQGSFPCSGLLEQGRSWSLSQSRKCSARPDSTPDLPAARKPKAWEAAGWGWLWDTFCPVITFIFLSTVDCSISSQCGALYRGIYSIYPLEEIS